RARMILWSAASRRSAVPVMFSLLVILPAPLAAAEDPSPETEAIKREREARLEKMRALAGRFDITSAAVDEAWRPDLRGEPLFRYSDQPRGFVDATLWAWGPPGRPAAVAKVEAAVNGNVPYWQFCVASLADRPIRIDFANQQKLTAPRAGLTMKA